MTDDKPLFDSWISSIKNTHELKIVYLDSFKNNTITIETCKFTSKDSYYSIDTIKQLLKKKLSFDEPILNKVFQSDELSTNTHLTKNSNSDYKFDFVKTVDKIENKLLSNIIGLKYNI